MKKGANVNSQDMSGCTPLHLAARNGLDILVSINLYAHFLVGLMFKNLLSTYTATLIKLIIACTCIMVSWEGDLNFISDMVESFNILFDSTSTI